MIIEVGKVDVEVWMEEKLITMLHSQTRTESHTNHWNIWASPCKPGNCADTSKSSTPLSLTTLPPSPYPLSSSPGPSSPPCLLPFVPPSPPCFLCCHLHFPPFLLSLTPSPFSPLLFFLPYSLISSSPPFRLSLTPFPLPPILFCFASLPPLLLFFALLPTLFFSFSASFPHFLPSSSPPFLFFTSLPPLLSSSSSFLCRTPSHLPPHLFFPSLAPPPFSPYLPNSSCIIFFSYFTLLY